MPLKIFHDEVAAEPSSRIKSVVAVAAGKGGVGKSTVAVNLALALHREGHSVGLLDADIYGPSVRRMLPEERLPEQRGKNLVPALCRGVRTITMAYFRKEHEAAVVRAPIANGIVTQFLRQVDRGDLDFLLIDFPPGTGDVQLTLSQQAHLTAAVMVTTPQELGVMDVRKAANMFEQVKVPILGVVENMSYYRHEGTGEEVFLFGRGGGERFASEQGVPLLGTIPLDPEMCRCSDEGRSIFEERGIGGGREAFIDLAAAVKAHLKGLGGTGEGAQESFELVWQEMR